MIYWYILQVATNREFQVQQRLIELEYQTIVPTQRVYRRSRGRGKPGVQKDVPLMPGYIVFGGESIDWIQVWGQPNVNGVLGVGNQPARLSEEVVDYIRNMHFAPITPRQLFAKGDKVTIINSPWNAGVITVDSVKGKTADVLVRAFNTDIKARVSVDDLEQAG